MYREQGTLARRSLGLGLVAAGLAAGLLVGCRSTDSNGNETRAPEAASTKEESAKVEREKMKVSVKGAESELKGNTLKIDYPVLKDKNDRIPDWVINPGLGGVTGAVGVSAKKGLGTREQIDEARLNARLELASMLESRLQKVGRSQLEEMRGVTGVRVSEQAQRKTLGIDRDILDMVLAGTRQRALWFDPDNSECYVWLVLDGRVLKAVDHIVVDSVSAFVATEMVSSEYRPERRKPEVPQVIVEPPAAAPRPAPKPKEPAPPKTPVEKLEESLKPIKTIPIPDESKEAKKGK